MTLALLAVLLLGAQAGEAPPVAAPSQPDLYYVVFLRPDPARRPLAKADAERIQSAHTANIGKMAQDGILVAAGPFEDQPTTISGIFVFKTSSLQRAQQVAALDPTVIEHRNTADVRAWHGPRGIGEEYFRLHKEHPETPENMQAHPLCLVYSGARWGAETGQRARLLAAHDAFVEGLRIQGKLGAAGSVEDATETAGAGQGALLGMVIFKALALDEAQALLAEDPAVKSGALRLEWHRWWSADHVLPW